MKYCEEPRDEWKDNALAFFFFTFLGRLNCFNCVPQAYINKLKNGIFYFIIALSGYNKISGCESEFWKVNIGFLESCISCNFAHEKQNDMFIVF